MNQELKNKIQSIINQKENQLSNILKSVHQWGEEIGTLKRLRDLEGEELLMCLGWLSINRNEPQLTSEIKENLTETMEKEISLIENNNLLAQHLTKEELLSEIRKRVDQGEIDLNEVVN